MDSRFQDSGGEKRRRLETGNEVSGNMGAQTEFLILLSDASIPIPQHHKTHPSCSMGTNKEWREAGLCSSLWKPAQKNWWWRPGSNCFYLGLLATLLPDKSLRVGEAGEKVQRALVIWFHSSISWLTRLGRGPSECTAALHK